jgi:DNA-binding response OmpR family regulator
MLGPKILIVEDEFLIRLTLAEALADEGFDVLEAGTGDDALGLLQEHPGIELLLTDIQLPGKLDGIGLAQEARRQASMLPVIYMTGRPDSMIETGRSGREAFIAKPYLPSEVCATARRLTGR